MQNARRKKSQEAAWLVDPLTLRAIKIISRNKHIAGRTSQIGPRTCDISTCILLAELRSAFQCFTCPSQRPLQEDLLDSTFTLTDTSRLGCQARFTLSSCFHSERGLGILVIPNGSFRVIRRNLGSCLAPFAGSSVDNEQNGVKGFCAELG